MASDAKRRACDRSTGHSACFLIYLVLSSYAISVHSAATADVGADAGGNAKSSQQPRKWSRKCDGDQVCCEDDPRCLEGVQGPAKDLAAPTASGLFAPTSTVVDALAQSGGGAAAIARAGVVLPKLTAEARRLPEVETQNVEGGWFFPTGMSLMAGTSLGSAFGSGEATRDTLNLMAGFKYFSLILEGPAGTQFGVQHAGGVVKLVDGTTIRSECDLSYHHVPMMLTQSGTDSGAQSEIPSALAMGATKISENQEAQLILDLTYPHLVFMESGNYKICYNPQGSFEDPEARDKSIVWPIPITVYGVNSPCIENNCMLEQERWYCYFSYRAEDVGPCSLDMRTTGGRAGWSVLSGGESRVSWSKAWDDDDPQGPPDIFGDPTFVPTRPEPCSDTVTAFTIEPDTNFLLPLEASDYIGITSDSGRAALLPKINGTSAWKSFTVTACYCPNYKGRNPGSNPCDMPWEFIQPVGAVHFWMIRICDPVTWQACGFQGPAEGSGPYMRIMPHQPLVLRLQCPPGGVCSGSADHKIRFIRAQRTGEEEYPTWHPLHSCRQPDEPDTPNITWTETNPPGDVTGGAERHFKAWTTRQLLALKTFGETFDVCYCDTGCNEQTNFFKVGTLRTMENVGVARWHRIKSVTDIVEPLQTLKYVGKFGSLTLYGGETSPLSAGMLPYDSVPFTKEGLVKIISFDRDELYDAPGAPSSAPKVSLEKSLGLQTRMNPDAQRGLDRACQTAGYSGDLVGGPASVAMAKEYVATVPPGGTTKYYSFSGKDQDQTFPALKAGVISVCYCAMVDSANGECADDEFWLSAARIMILGPAGGAEIKLPTNFVVRIEITGWGFTSNDTLRPITLTQSCSENDWSPIGEFGFKLGCPGYNSSDCHVPGRLTNIDTYVKDSSNTGCYIKGVEIGELNSTLAFDCDVLTHFTEGDALTIDEDTVLLLGQPKSVWTTAERYIVSKLTGFYEYPDDPSETRMLWNRVSYAYTSDGSIDRSKLSINVGWPEGKQPGFSFVNERGEWSLRNRLQTYEEVYANDPGRMKLCWGVRDNGAHRYYGDAGTLVFANPDTMDDAGVHISGEQENTLVPTVISFTPRRSSPALRVITEPIILRILFRDIDNELEPLLTGAPSAGLYEGAPVPPLGTLDPDDEVPYEQASQRICGMLFSEMWTNDEGGFPFVKGCYYGPRYQDKPAEGSTQTPGGYREYFIAFEQHQGLLPMCTDYRSGRRSPCAYQLVLNTMVHKISSLDKDVVGLYTRCAPKAEGEEVHELCGGRYGAIEYGPGKPSRLTYPTNYSLPTLRRVELARRYGLRNGTQGINFEVEEEWINEIGQRYSTLEIRAWPFDPTLPIEKSSHLRIVFLPLTVWDFAGDVCTARCIPPTDHSCDDMRGGNFFVCNQEPVVETRFDSLIRMPRNLLDLEYPRGMERTRGAYRFNETQTIDVDEIKLPVNGFFPRRFLAQLSQYILKFPFSPSVVETVQVFRHVPAYGATSGRLLAEGQAASGPQPFKGNRNNELMVRLVLGFTLHHYTPFVYMEEEEHNETEADDFPTTTALPPDPWTLYPKVEILLPEDYTCSIVGTGMADPEGQQEYFNIDVDGDGFKDNFQGTLVSLGSWSSKERNCTFTLDHSAAIFANQIFYFKISVINPWNALHRDDPRNVWYVRTQGVDGEILQPLVPFISLEEESKLRGWVGNLAVITPLTNELIQPTSFLPNATHQVHIFFKAQHWLPEESLIFVDAPENFEFYEDCIVSNLPDQYYADYYAQPAGQGRVGDNARLRSLGDTQNCSGDAWARGMFDPPATKYFNRAMIRIRCTLEPGAIYGFRVKVTNPEDFSLGQHTGWRLWIKNPKGYPLDGSRQTVTFSGSRVDTLPPDLFDMSWALYRRVVSHQVRVDFVSHEVMPTSVRVLRTSVNIFPLFASDTITASLRIIAPPGYRWKTEAGDGFQGQVPGLTCGNLTCQIFPRPVVPFLADNELLLPGIVLQYGVRYGFQTWMEIPDRPPTKSTNTFYYELGYDGTSLNSRHQAGLLDPPIIRAIYDVSIFSLCNAAGYGHNILEYHVTTITDLTKGMGFVFEGDGPTYLTDIPCPPETVPGKMPLPWDLECHSFTDDLTELPVIQITVGNYPLPAGSYGFLFRGVKNGISPTPVAGRYFIGTYEDVVNFPALTVVDKGISTPSPRLFNWMWANDPDGDTQPNTMAGMLNMPEYLAANLSRDDRPGRQNKLIFYFKMREQRGLSIVGVPFVSIRGPYGFEFAENCTDTLRALHANTSGGASGDFPWPCMQEPVPSWCPGLIDSWPGTVKLSTCLGLGRTAILSASGVGSIEPEKIFAFEVGVKNPVDGDTDGQWAMDVLVESSIPFSAFKVRTFNRYETSMYALSKVVTPASRSGVATPIAIHFTPTLKIPGRGPYGAIHTHEGSLVFQAPQGFTMDLTGRGDCPTTILEVAGRAPGDDAAVFQDGSIRRGDDTECRVENGNRLVFTFVGEKSLQVGVRYRLVVLVKNPPDPQKAAPFELLSFKRELASDHNIPMDSMLLDGFDVSLGMFNWEVINYSEEYLGEYKVRTVTFKIGFGATLMHGDSIKISAPPGFDLMSQSSGTHQGTCDSFRWPSVILPLPDSPPPQCHCEILNDGRKRCELMIQAIEPTAQAFRGGIILKPEEVLIFNMSTINPYGPPDLVENYWMVEHRHSSGLLLGAKAAEGWPVYGQITNISLITIGTMQRAGVDTDLRLSFVPSVWAFVLEVLLEDPPAFDFSDSRFEPPFRRAAAVGGRLVVVGGEFPAHQATKMNILKVRMGFPGGGTRLTIRLFLDSQLRQQVNQRLSFIRGFRVPGALNILRHRLWSEDVVHHYERDESKWDVVKPLMPPWAHEPRGIQQLARVEMQLNVSMPVFKRQHLVIANLANTRQLELPHRPYVEAGYEPTLEMCINTKKQIIRGAYEPTGYAAVEPLPCTVVEKVNFTNVREITLDGLPYGLNLTLNTSGIYARPDFMVALVANFIYRLRFWVQPTQHDSIWRAETEDGGELPTNTNDDLTIAVRAVNRMTIEVTSAYSRIPPNSVVDFDIRVQVLAQQTDFQQLEVALPPGLAPWGVQNVVSTRPDGTKRLVTRLDITATALQEIRETGKTFTIRLLTPASSSLDDRWFVMAKSVVDTGSDVSSEVEMEGWAVANGFDVIPLPATIVYPPVEQFQGWLSISFTTPIRVKGTFAQIDAPPTYQLVCPNDPLFLQGACNTNRGSTLPGSFVNVTLVEGKREGANMVYAFVVGIITPKIELAAEPFWNVRVLNDEHLVVDALIGWRGDDIVKDLFLQQPTLSWVSPPQHGETSVVSIELTLDRRTPTPDEDAGTKSVKALLITLPDRYKHDIIHKNQLKSLNRYFPVAIDTEWRNYGNLRWIKILANDGVTEQRDFLPPGTFQFQFPVRVPRELPARMEWYLSMCYDFLCETLEDPSILANFPMPNTDPIKEARPWASAVPVGGAQNRRRMLSPTIIMAVLFVVTMFLEPAGQVAR